MQVRREKKKVEEESQRAAVEAAKQELKAKEVRRIETECRVELFKAEPSVLAAEEALDTVTKKDLGELKSFKKPPSTYYIAASCVVRSILQHYELDTMDCMRIHTSCCCGACCLYVYT